MICADAIDLGSVALVEYSFDTSTLPQDLTAPIASCAFDPDDPDTRHAHWWGKWTAPRTGLVSVDTFASDYDTLLSVWTGACGSLAELECSEDDAEAPDYQSRVLFVATEGITYYIQVSSYSAGGGMLGLTVRQPDRPAFVVIGYDRVLRGVAADGSILWTSSDIDSDIESTYNVVVDGDVIYVGAECQPVGPPAPIIECHGLLIGDRIEQITFDAGELTNVSALLGHPSPDRDIPLAIKSGAMFGGSATLGKLWYGTLTKDTPRALTSGAIATLRDAPNCGTVKTAEIDGVLYYVDADADGLDFHIKGWNLDTNTPTSFSWMDASILPQTLATDAQYVVSMDRTPNGRLLVLTSEYPFIAGSKTRLYLIDVSGAGTTLDVLEWVVDAGGTIFGVDVVSRSDRSAWILHWDWAEYDASGDPPASLVHVSLADGSELGRVALDGSLLSMVAFDVLVDDAPPPSGTFAGWLAWPDREEIVLCELDPSFTLAGFDPVGGSPTTTYSIALPRMVQTAQIVGGLYTRCLGVRENDTDLTERSSLVLVEANAGSWFWDEDTELLYVHSTTGADPDLFTFYQATRRLYLSNAPIVLNRVDDDPDTGIYYHPMLTDELPHVRREVEDLLFGSKNIPSGSVAFTNGHEAWFTLVAQDGLWNWKNKTVRFLIGGSYNGLTLNRSQYETQATMVVEDVAPDDQVCRFDLQPLDRFTELEVPVTPYFEDTYPNLGDGVRGTKKWIGYGRATIPPDLTDSTLGGSPAAFGVYTVADAAFQTLFAIYNVWAISKNTQVWTLLVATVDYTYDLTACTVTIVNATYVPQDYTLAVDVAGEPDGAGSYLQKFGSIARDLLEKFLGTTDLDDAAFDAADVEASSELALWIKEPRSLASILQTAEPAFPSLGRSSMGRINQTIEGQFTASVWTPGIEDIDTSLRREDFAAFRPAPKLKTVFSAVRVNYNYDHVRKQWSVVEVSSSATQYKTGSRDVLELFTYHRTGGSAESLAERYQLLAGAITVQAEFEERGALLCRHEAGDKVNVTYRPAPSVAGEYIDKPFEILSMEVAYAPKLKVTGLLGDLRGIGGTIGRWMDSDAPDWADATSEERLRSGFWCDSNGRPEPSDPASANQSIWW